MLDQNILLIIIGVVALVIGIIAGKFIFAVNTRKQVEAADEQAQKIIRDAQANAENLKKEKLLEAKEKFVQMKAEHDKEVLERNRRISETENRIKQRELSINQKMDQLEKQVKDNDSI
ncbi:MAG TPA: Rnase Y domain-containing protein, partial [Chitinophagaceae bacterium]